MSLNYSQITRLDPTRTLTLRRSFEIALTGRFRWLKQLIKKSVVKNDCFGYKVNKTRVDINNHVININNAMQVEQLAFERDLQKVALFMDWLREQINLGILEVVAVSQLGNAVEKAWTNVFIVSAYKKGITRGRQELKNKGYQVPKLDTNSLQATFNHPLHADRAGVVYSRTFESLKGITDEMSKQISGVLAQGIIDGKPPVELAREMTDRVDKIGITRAKILARTEVIRSHHLATIQEYKNWGVEGVTVLAEMITAGDGRVCPICKTKARKNTKFGKGVYTLAQAEGLIPVHPQCRCICLPLDITDNKKLLKKLKKVS